MARAESLYLRGTEAYRQGNFDAALAACDSLLAQTIEAAALAAVLNLKALSLAGKGLMFEAADCIGQAIQKRTDDALLQHHAARILLESGRLGAARQAAEKACRLAPEHSGYRYHLARVYLRAGESKQAEEMARQCVEADPAAYEAWLLLSEIAWQSDDRQRAVTCLKEVVRQERGHARAWAQLASMAPDGEPETSVRQALERLRTGAEETEDAATASFALADIARRSGHHSQAFAYYSEANGRLAADRPFGMDDWEKAVENSIAASGDWLDSAPWRAGRDSAIGDQLVFIVGMPRSGTSLCEQVICAHPGVLGAGELATMEYIEKALRNRGFDPFGTQADPVWVEEMRNRYTESFPPGSDGYMRITDKTPRNFERLGLVFRLFPAARVLWCVRHPLDTILSCFFQDFGASQKFSRSLEHCARMYAGHVRLMRHWMRYFGEQVHIVDYACLVQRLDASAHAIADFLDLEFDPAMLQPHRNPRMVWTASSAQVKQPVHTGSLDKWLDYREEISAVRAMLQQQGLLDAQGRSTVLN